MQMLVGFSVINKKMEIKKSTQPHEYQGFGGLYYVANNSAEE